MPVDPRLSGVPLGIQDPLQAQLAALSKQLADQQRQINDMRQAATIQTGTSSPSAAGLLGRDGTPYGSTAPAFWIRVGGAWRGVSLPLT